MSINRVIITGNLTFDADLKHTTTTNTEVLNFSVAVNDRRKNQKTGEWEDVPNFIDCTIFGNRAKNIAPYLTKGTKVSVEGKLRYSSWTKDDQKRSRITVIVDEIEFNNRNNQNNVATATPAASIPAPPAEEASNPAYDEDIPF